ncbi:MAG: response regulator transcription factor [Chloroflexi bacterium]|uniref:Response regulator transcription factor n=1 Tax=Candidatus Chlorohelix allophototropha TaxID=3003348 RepID=A0A8T7M247_9CHLR|nr:response regulator transcription factor [Chloroflexota bacterium]WJW66897.1 response regulator transcription factor [Chloroflexota bacterium L227-S17]
MIDRFIKEKKEGSVTGNDWRQDRRSQKEKPRLLIVDDHPLFLRGVKTTLEDSGEFQVVGEAPDGQRAIMLAEQLLPDVILIDINLPGMNGLEVSRVIKRRQPQSNIIILSVYEDDEQLFNAIKAGAAAYSPKDISPERLVDIVRQVARGNYIINDNVLSKPTVASRVLNQFRELSTTENENEPIFAPLTPREVEILDCIARGNSNKEIARSLSISDQTVKNHITSILKKLNANDRTQAVITALRHGWIKMSSDISGSGHS